MLKIYGCDLCPDCVNCKADLDKAGVAYEYCSIGDNLRYLKEFLALRDTAPAFTEVKKAGKIGIPCIVDEEGNLSLTWAEYL